MSGFAKFSTYYEALEVSPNASQAVIRAAYKSLIQRYHPDKNLGNPEMEERTVLIGQAFEVLSDPVKRKAYDLELKRRKSSQSLQRRRNREPWIGVENCDTEPD